MAQFLVMLIDKVNENDPAGNAKAYKTGDVVSIREDDDVPYEKDAGTAERLGTWWTVVRAPGKVAEYSDYTKHEEGDSRINRMLQRRIFKFDVAAAEKLPGAKNENTLVLASAQHAVAVKTMKPQMADPGFIV